MDQQRLLSDHHACPPAPCQRAPGCLPDGKIGAGEGNQEALGETTGKFRSNGRKSALWQRRRATLWKALVWQEVIQDKHGAAFWGGLADRQDGREPGIWAGEAVKAVWLCALLRSPQAVGEGLPPCPESAGWYPQPMQGAEGAFPTIA